MNAGKVEPRHTFLGLFTDTRTYGRIAVLRYGLYGPMPYRKPYRKMTAERPDGTGTVPYIRHPYLPYVRGRWASLGCIQGPVPRQAGGLQWFFGYYRGFKKPNVRCNGSVSDYGIFTLLIPSASILLASSNRYRGYSTGNLGSSEHSTCSSQRVIA